MSNRAVADLVLVRPMLRAYCQNDDLNETKAAC